MNGEQLRLRRTAARIPGLVVSRKAAISRTRLSGIELGYIEPKEDELRRLSAALDELVRVRLEVQKLARRMGWPTGVEISPSGKQEALT